MTFFSQNNLDQFRRKNILCAHWETPVLWHLLQGTLIAVKRKAYLYIYDNIEYCCVEGKKGIYTSTSGLTIAYLSGTDGTMSAASDGSTFTNDDIDSLRHSLSGESKGVDILLTSPWAQNVYKYASKPVCTTFMHVMILLSIFLIF